MKKMAILVTVIVLLLGMAGCVSAKYNPETKEVSYTRIGDQKLSGILIESDPDTGKISILIEAQKSEARAFQDAGSLILKAVEIGKTIP